MWKQYQLCTVNARYCGRSRDREFVSSIERVRNNGRLFQSNVWRDFAAVRINGVSVVARYPQGESWLYYHY